MKITVSLTHAHGGPLKTGEKVTVETTPEALAEAFYHWNESTNGKNTRDPYNPGSDFWFGFVSDNAEVKLARAWVGQVNVYPEVTFALNCDLTTRIIVVNMVYATRMTPEWYFVEADESGCKFTLIKPKLRVEADGSFIGDGVYFPHDDDLWPLPVLERDDLEVRGILNWLLCKRESAPLRALIKSGQPYKAHALQILERVERLQTILDEK